VTVSTRDPTTRPPIFNPKEKPMPTPTSVPTQEAPVTSTDTADLLAEVAAERQRQDAIWGEQNYPDGTARNGQTDRDLADLSRRLCKEAAAAGLVTWRMVLDEEMREAFAESDPVALRAELIQVAAVAVAWVEAIDRRRVAATAAALSAGKPSAVTA
jgi:hypothetical protein